MPFLVGIAEVVEYSRDLDGIHPVVAACTQHPAEEGTWHLEEEEGSRHPTREDEHHGLVDRVARRMHHKDCRRSSALAHPGCIRDWAYCQRNRFACIFQLPLWPLSCAEPLASRGDVPASQQFPFALYDARAFLATRCKHP